jgi:NTE family protein
MTTPKIGYALSGGIVLGAAHVGVLEVLEAGGVRPSCIAGTSIGAVVGALYASGLPAAEVRDLMLEIGSWGDVVSPTWKLGSALVSTEKMRGFLVEKANLTTFEALAIPFAAVACNLDREERVVLRAGDLAAAVSASCAVPGLFPAEHVDGRFLVDGGIIDNLPVAAVRALGAQFTVAVDLLSGPVAPIRDEGLWQIVQRTLRVVLRGSHPRPGEEALPDYSICPRTGDLSFTDFGQVETLMERGREAAREALPALLAALATAAPTAS